LYSVCTFCHQQGSDDGVVIRTDRNSVECVSDCDVVVNCLHSCNISNSAVVSVDDMNVTNDVQTEMPEQSNIDVTNKSVSKPSESGGDSSAHHMWHSLAEIKAVATSVKPTKQLYS